MSDSTDLDVRPAPALEPTGRPVTGATPARGRAVGSALVRGATVAQQPSRASAAELVAAAERATRLVAPLWPLDRFVAVNPFLGASGERFERAADRYARAFGARMTQPRAAYREALDAGRLERRHLATALEAARARAADDPLRRALLPADVGELERRLRDGSSTPTPERAPTVADVVGRVAGNDWTRFCVERLSAFAAAHFDAGQSPWGSPWRDRPLFGAWREAARIDRTPEVAGLAGFRATVATLPEEAETAVAEALTRLGIGADAVEAYVERLSADVAGWMGYARRLAFEAELAGRRDATPLEVLAVRLAQELAILEGSEGEGRRAWVDARAALVQAPTPEAGRALDLICQEAHELALQERLIDRLGRRTDVAPAPRSPRPRVQAVFCIDVRSEVFRRRLESIDAGLETLGFAGFFGFALEVRGLGDPGAGAHCPVLLRPAAGVQARPAGDLDRGEVLTRRRRDRARVSKVWKGFKQGAVSCFSFVGPVGLAYARKLVSDGFGLTRPVPHPDRAGLSASEHAELGPELDTWMDATAPDRAAFEQQVDLAEGALRAMGLVEGFARLVVLVGHGSTTVNNPHASGLDCGACGGRTGEVSARVAARVLGDARVRAALARRGIAVPDDTVFLAGLHDTTTDAVALFDLDRCPASHAADLEALRRDLAEAGRLTRSERAPRLGLAVDAGSRLLARSRDWAQVRPEWGLAGCAAFIAAPRHRTAGLDLSGQAFLHGYDWRADTDRSVLELILTAPVVVASWISLQYYGSTVDNRAFGSGNKTLHNVVGGLGVFEGTGGDLRAGLPWQSVHDGERPAHEPVRLNVVVEAPSESLLAVLGAHPEVRELFDNGWLHLWAMDDAGRVAERYAGGLRFEPVADPGA